MSLQTISSLTNGHAVVSRRAESTSHKDVQRKSRAVPSTLILGLAGAALYWAALPPLGWSLLGWIAVTPWLFLIRGDHLDGRRPYAILWLGGFIFWLAAIHWIRLPHPALYLGWCSLAAYLAFYLPVFVGLSRVAVHRWRVPLWLAAPVVWTGLELARAHLLSGFLMASLAHTQAKWPIVIQISDLGGQYLVDFLLVLTAAGMVALLPSKKSDWRSAIPAAVCVTATLVYGQFKLMQPVASDAGPRLALVQGNSLADWKAQEYRQQRIMSEYISLSEAAVKLAGNEGQPVDLVIWPETMFRTGLLSFDPGFVLPEDVKLSVDELSAVGPNDLKALVQRLDTAVLVGIDRVHYLSNPDGIADTATPRFYAYNSAVLVDRSGNLLGTYDKMHRVMFGEYIPLAKWFPFVYRLTPLTGGIEAGSEPVALELNDVSFSPSICYETVLAHVIRRQFVTLSNLGKQPDILVNLTNDAWYWGSSELDMHLACGVFRAVESRTPLVIAANGGLSASIDANGQILKQSPRQTTDVLLADVTLDPRGSLYLVAGDWFAAVCLLCCVILAITGWRMKSRVEGQETSARKP